MTSLPLISHRMFVAAIQDDTGARPARSTPKTPEVPADDGRGAADNHPDAAAVPETAFPSEPVPVLGT